MSETKSYSVRLTLDEIDRANESLELVREENDDPNLTKAQSFMKIIEYYILKPDRQYHDVEIRKAKEKEIESLCEFDLLKQIIDPKDQRMKWYCLKRLRFTGSGSPILMGDGFDHETIKELCNACVEAEILYQKTRLGEKGVQAIIKFGDSPIEVLMYACTHPENEFVQVRLGDIGSFICPKKNARADIKRTCIEQICKNLYSEKATIKVKETEPFKEMAKQLESKGGD